MIIIEREIKSKRWFKMTKSRSFRVKWKKREVVMFQSLLVLIGISLIGLPSQHSLLGTPIQEQHNFAEIFQIKVQEKRLKNGKYYQVYLLLQSGKKIFLGKQIPIFSFNPSHYIRDISMNLAQFIDCSYSFMPAPSFWKF
jgi:hypothetical protein